MERGKNGQQQSEENVRAFRAWVLSKTDEEFRSLLHRGQLNRTEIAKECGFGKSALVQNPSIKLELADLENRLRERAILSQPVQPDDAISVTTVSVNRDDERVKRLEGENAMLRAEVEKYRKYMKRYNLMERFMVETMRMPR